MHRGYLVSGLFTAESFNLSVCVCVCVSSTAKAEHHCLFSGSQEDSEDQSALIVGVVVGLLVAAAVVGLIYWLYVKNSRYGKTTLAFGIYICHSRRNSRWCCSCSCKPTAHFKQEKRGDFCSSAGKFGKCAQRINRFLSNAGRRQALKRSHMSNKGQAAGCMAE